MHNNLIDIILWESCKIWSFNTILDLMLSLRTGTEDEMKFLTALHFYYVFNDGFIPCLCHSFMAGLDSEHVWIKLKNQLNENICSDYFQFNISLQVIEPSLNNINLISKLKQCIHLQPFSKHDYKKQLVWCWS